MVRQVAPVFLTDRTVLRRRRSRHHRKRRVGHRPDRAGGAELLGGPRHEARRFGNLHRVRRMGGCRGRSWWRRHRFRFDVGQLVPYQRERRLLRQAEVRLDRVREVRREVACAENGHGIHRGRRDQAEHLFEPPNLPRQSPELAVEPADLLRGLPLDMAPLTVVVLTDDVPQLGFREGLLLVGAELFELLGLGSQPMKRAGDEVGMTAELVNDLGERLPRSSFAMVGDDLRADVAAAQRVGMKGILVLSGKTSAADVERASRGSGRGPDGIAPTLADVVAALD